MNDTASAPRSATVARALPEHRLGPGVSVSAETLTAEHAAQNASDPTQIDDGPVIGGTPTPHCDWRPPDYQHIAWWMVNFMAR